jgi:L-2-hydroxyglutarate oxidase LhgO
MIPRRTTPKPVLVINRARAFLAHLARARCEQDHHRHLHASSSFDFETDVLVIGAGVVGLAVAREAARRGARVVVAERNESVGMETSSRSSEVIHAGLYYPPGSLKAEMCARGRDMLYDYCASKGVAHKQIGKLVVATTEGRGDDSALDALAQNAEAATRLASARPLDLELLTGDEARDLEPALGPRVCRALLSPRTGIVDSHALMQALLSDAEEAGAVLALRSAAVPMPPAASKGGEEPSHQRMLRVAIRDAGGGAEGETAVMAARSVVNCAGLGAEAVARGALAHLGRGSAAASAPHLRFAKGHYFELAGGGGAPSASLPFFSRLVYPLPSGDGGLGVHLTLDLAGRPRFGPDVEWLPAAPPPSSSPSSSTTSSTSSSAASTVESPEFDFSVPPDRAAEARWHDAIRRYWPGLPPLQESAHSNTNNPFRLVPAYAGVRPKLSGPGDPAEDFGFQTARAASWRGGSGHGVRGLVCLYGVESPGLTSALALAERVVDEALA